MDIIPDNPFTIGPMIMKEEDFIGREAQLSDILTHIRNQGSVSIVGDRRIGKSSLLYHIFLTGNRRLEDIDNKRFNFIYIDLHDPRFKTVSLFLPTIGKKVKSGI